MKKNKSGILKECLNLQESQVERFEERLDSIKADVSSNNHSPSQTEDRKAGKVELIHNYEKELVFAKLELNVLNSIKTDVIHNHIELGSVVYTKDLNFFISVSIGKFSVDGIDFMGISTKAPIYKVMEGKKKGDTFSFNDATYSIDELF